MKTGRSLKTLFILVVILAATCCLSSCTSWDSFYHTFIDEGVDNENNTIYIGVFEPETGANSEEGIAEVKGIELANSIYNSVNGYKVELIKVDTKSSTNVADTAIQSLIEMKPVAIIGSAGEATSLIASKYVGKAGIPTITPSATNPLITSKNSYYFRACITDSQMGAGIAEYVYQKKQSRNIGIVLGLNDSSTTALMDGFNDKLIELGGKKRKSVKLEMNSDFSEKGMQKIIDKLKKGNVDTLIIPQGTETMDAFFTMVEENGLTNITYVGSNSWQNDDFVKMMRKHKNINIAFPKDSVLDEDSYNMSEEAQRFAILYHNKYGDDDMPSNNAVLGYDSYLLLINAIHNAKDLDGNSIRAALSQLEGIMGASGEFSFDAQGNTKRTVTISTIRNRKIKALYVTKDTAEVKDVEDQVDAQKEEQTNTKQSGDKKTTEKKKEDVSYLNY